MTRPTVKFGIFGNIAKPAIAEATLLLLSLLRKKKVPFILHDELGKWLNALHASKSVPRGDMCKKENLAQHCEILIALGGDGTMLQAARIMGRQGKPILGVNIGKLGFLAEISTDHLEQSVNDILRGRFVVEERMVLESRSVSTNRHFYGLNDIVIDKGSSSRVISIETYVDEEYLTTYTADGIIVNTPTGSTAYSLATGGPIVVPRTKVITINPIAPHALTARPMIVPDASMIRMVVTADFQKVRLTADGQEEQLFKSPAEFVIKKAPYTIKLVKSLRGSFYDTLRKKLLWGRDLRVKSANR